jgi:hypothetical protein
VEQWELEAREQVRDTVIRYAHCADSGRFTELAELFAADGVLEVAGELPHAGRDAILAFLTGTGRDLATATATPLIRHHVSNVLIDFESSERARASSYFFVVTERGPDHWGRYRDRLTRTGDRWLFSHRTARTDGMAAGSWAAEREARA